MTQGYLKHPNVDIRPGARIADIGTGTWCTQPPITEVGSGGLRAIQHMADRVIERTPVQRPR